MEVFNIIAGSASIIALIISLFTLGKVVKINNSINTKQNAKTKGENSPINQIGQEVNGE